MEKTEKTEKKKTRRGRDFFVRLVWGIIAIIMIAGVSFTLIYTLIRG